MWEESVKDDIVTHLMGRGDLECFSTLDGVRFKEQDSFVGLRGDS
jgi:hypothetical protein